MQFKFEIKKMEIEGNEVDCLHVFFYKEPIRQSLKGCEPTYNVLYKLKEDHSDLLLGIDCSVYGCLARHEQDAIRG